MEVNYLISKEAALNNFRLSGLKNGTVLDIDITGDLNLFIAMPNVQTIELDKFLNDDAKLYYYSKGGKSAIIIEWCIAGEYVFCPMVCPKESFDLFMNKEEVQIVCLLYDSLIGDIIETRVLKISGKILNAVKDSFNRNAPYTQSELNEWTLLVLYSKSTKKNIRESLYLGKTSSSEDKILLY